MIDASSAVQTAVVALLRADAVVSAVVGQRIYASPPDNGPMPMITLGPSDAVKFHRADRHGSSTTLQIDCWAQAGEDARDQMKVCRDLVHAVTAALDLKQPTIAGWHLFGRLVIDNTRFFSDPDGVTAHGVITLRAEMAPA